MKSKLILLFCVICISSVSADEFYLNVKLKDGTTATFSVQEIIKITFNEISKIKDVNEFNNFVKTFVLFQNYPNPFNPTTTIEYQLPRAGETEIKIFNVKGQLIKKITKGFQQAGNYKIEWDGKDAAGQKVTSGLYIYQIKFENTVLSKKMILTR